MLKEGLDPSRSNSSTAARSAGEPKAKPAPKRTVSSDEGLLSRAKQPKLTTKAKGKGKARDMGTESVPPPRHSPPPLDPDDSEAAQIQLAIQRSLMESQHGRAEYGNAGSSSRAMTMMASQSFIAPSIDRFLSSSSTDTSSYGSAPRTSEPWDNSSIGTSAARIFPSFSHFLTALS